MRGLGEEDCLAGFSGDSERRRDDGLSGGLEPFVRWQQADPNSRVAGLTDWSRN